MKIIVEKIFYNIIGGNFKNGLKIQKRLTWVKVKLPCILSETHIGKESNLIQTERTMVGSLHSFLHYR